MLYAYCIGRLIVAQPIRWNRTRSQSPLLGNNNNRYSDLLSGLKPYVRYRNVSIRDDQRIRIGPSSRRIKADMDVLTMRRM